MCQITNATKIVKTQRKKMLPVARQKLTSFKLNASSKNMPKKKKLKEEIKLLKKKLKKAKSSTLDVNNFTPKNPPVDKAVIHNPGDGEQCTIYESIKEASEKFVASQTPGSTLLVPLMHIAKQVDGKKKTAKDTSKA